jgi:molybdenum cofactor biosynthesis enzyme MoaA
MAWYCKAIDHGVTIFPDKRIGPCCQISPDYLKSIDLISDPKRFVDLKTEHPPLACEKCSKQENNGLPSYRQFFNSHMIADTDNIVFLDIRNTNQCNLKCRYCNPYFSNQWAKELNFVNPLQRTDLTDYLERLLTDDLQLIYFTGGEPMISADHWNILHNLTSSRLSHKVKLMYNTNLTVIKFKDVDFFDLWKQFARVDLTVSIDAIGSLFNSIRSGAQWHIVEHNLNWLCDKNCKQMKVSVTCVLSILNIWNLTEFIRYFQTRAIPINFILLEGPDYLALDVIPDELKELALIEIEQALTLLNHASLIQARKSITNNQNQSLFKHCLSHVLLLDALRDENLFDLLPFRDLSKDLIANNNEYR